MKKLLFLVFMLLSIGVLAQHGSSDFVTMKSSYAKLDSIIEITPTPVRFLVWNPLDSTVAWYSDAPSDGSQYARYNGTWQIVTPFTYPSSGVVVSTGSGWGTSLSNTTVGTNLLTATNPSALTYIQVSADNTISFLSGSGLRVAIGAGTMSSFWLCGDGEVGSQGWNIPDGSNVRIISGAGVHNERTGYQIQSSLDINSLTSTTGFNAAPYMAFYDAVNGDSKIALSNVNLTYFSSGTAASGYVPTADGAGGISWAAQSGGGISYPGAGIPISTGSAWGTSIVDSSYYWNYAYQNLGKVYTSSNSTLAPLSGTYFIYSSGSGTYIPALSTISSGNPYLATAGSIYDYFQNYVPISRTITINGTSYDLSADRSWTISTGTGYWSRDATNGSVYPTTTTDHVTIGTSAYDSSYMLHSDGGSTTSGIIGATIYSFGVGVKGTSSSYYGVQGTSTSSAGVSGNSSTYTGVQGISTSGIGVSGSSSSSVGVYGYSASGWGGQFILNPSTTNTSESVIDIVRNTSGTASVGIGSAITFSSETAAGNRNSSGDGNVNCILTNATSTTSRSADFVWELGASGGSPSEKLRLTSGGQLKLNQSVTWSAGSGSPEGVVTANVGSFYSRTDGGSGTSFYVKESGTGNTGWVAK